MGGFLYARHGENANLCQKGKKHYFNNAEFGSVRTVTVNDEIMFVGKDLTDILGYQNGSRDINHHVDEEDRDKLMIFDGKQDKETTIINESGLYSLILATTVLTKLKKEREKRKQLECMALAQRQQIAEMRPKAIYYDLLLQNKNTVPITQIAKDYVVTEMHIFPLNEGYFDPTTYEALTNIHRKEIEVIQILCIGGIYL